MERKTKEILKYGPIEEDTAPIVVKNTTTSVVHETEKIVFVAKKPLTTEHPVEFVPMEHGAQDDELVYAPSFNVTGVPGVKSLVYEGCMQHV